MDIGGQQVPTGANSTAGWWVRNNGVGSGLACPHKPVSTLERLLFF